MALTVLLPTTCLPGFSSAAADGETTRELDALASTAFGAGGPGGVVLVARGGSPLLYRAYGLASIELDVPMRTDHAFKIASITKEFTAVAVLQLVAKGLVSLEADVHDYVPEFDTQGFTVTVEQVLTHTSGLPNVVDLPDFDRLSSRPLAVDELLSLTASMPFHFDPGTSYRYSDTGYQLLGAIVERVTGISYGTYLEREIFGPLSMSGSYFDDGSRPVPRLVEGYSLRDGEVVRAPHMDMTVPFAAGSVVSTAEDLARWQRALRDGRVIPPPLLARAWTPRDLPDGSRSGYGFGFKICAVAGHRSVEHGGQIPGFTAYALQAPEDGLDVIALVNSDAGTPDAALLAQRLARVALGQAAALPYRALDRREREALAGSYRLRSGAVAEVVERGGQLSWRVAGREAPLAALSPTKLTLTDSEGAFVLRFEIGDGERAESVGATERCEPALRGFKTSPRHPGLLAFHQDLAWSFDGSRLAYSRKEVSRERWERERYAALGDSDYDIWVVDADGGNERRLTDTPGDDVWLSWSPDGRRLVFSSERGGSVDLYVINVVGGRTLRLTADPGKESGPAWSPDGSRIAFSLERENEHQIWLIDADGSHRERVTSGSEPKFGPAWSPDGSMLAYYVSPGGTGADRVEIVPVDGPRSPRTLVEGLFPAWSPDGRSLTYSLERRLLAIDLDGTHRRIVAENAFFGRYSPDGRQIAFISGRFPDTQIWAVRLSDGGLRQLAR